MTAPPPPPHGPRIAVIIPHLNQPQMLARCLESLMAGHRRPDELIVVDNGSVELPTAVCDSVPGLRLVQEPQPGPGPARNRGIALTTSEVLAFIDADCLADPDWLAEAARQMEDPTANILGGDVRIAYGDARNLTAIEAYESVYAYRMDRYIAREGFTGTGNLVIRRAVYDDVGPFAGLAVAEDRDWGQRATARGYRIRYVPGMRVYHPARAQFAELFRKWDRQLAHDFTRARAEPGGLARWTLKMLAMGASPMAEIPRIATSDRIAGARARLLAFVGLVRVRAYRMVRMAWLLAGGDPNSLSGRWNRDTAPKG